MKSLGNLARRKAGGHIPQLVGLILLLGVGVCFFVTLFTISLRYEETAELYLDDQSYADVTLYGDFDGASVEELRRRDGVIAAEGRVVRDLRDGDLTLRVITLTQGINQPYLIAGELPTGATQCALLNRHAEARDLGVGDSIQLDGRQILITGVVASPEYIYLAQNERNPMADPQLFGVAFVTGDFFPAEYNEIVVLAEDGSFDDAEASETMRLVASEDQANYLLYRSDVDQIRSFAYIFPAVFAVLIALVIYVMVARMIQEDKRQIGIMKALGSSDASIIGVYLAPLLIVAMVGALVGGFAAIGVSGAIIRVFGSMFEVPTLSFAFYPVLWLGALSFALILCSLPGVLALRSILPLSPAEAMRPRLPRAGRRAVVERLGIFRRASFNSRYALKSALRNKGRLLAVIMGMSGSCALLTFSLGFNDSVDNTQERYFTDFARYDIIVSFEPMPLGSGLPMEELANETSRALVTSVKIESEDHTLVITSSGFDMLELPGNALHDGVVVPQYFADQWEVRVGDSLRVDDTEVRVSAIIPQYLGLAVYTSFEYMADLGTEVQVYNAVYARSENLGLLEESLIQAGAAYSTIDDDKASFTAMMESMRVLVWLLLACAIILGFTALYSVGLISLTAREYEYMFMGVMGYPHKGILLAHVKETFAQLLVAIPLGFIVGRALLETIKGEFSSSSFAIASTVRPASYLIAAVCVIGVCAALAAITSAHIRRIDIVEGLKVREG